MGVSYPVAGVSLDYTSVSTRDSFGRVIDHAWKTADETDVVRIQHGYDRGGNRLYRRDMLASAHSELYQYDQMNQLTAMQRGVLNAVGDTVTSKSFEEDFAFDMTGNWLNYKQDANGDDTFEVNQTRTHNTANEIQTISGGNTLVSHDRNGNMTKVPKPNLLSSAYTLVYDAWNRLISLSDGDTLVVTYMYDARNHRIKTTVGTTVTLKYFNQNWQEIESIAAGVTTTNVYGLRYIDDVIMRTSGNNGETQTLYALQDPNWNVCALLNISGAVQERITYDSFGKPTFRNANFTAKTASSYGWSKTFTGQTYDIESGLMLYRNRYYHTGLGRFITRDPIGYDGKDVNLYRYVRNQSLDFADFLGLVDVKAGGYIIRVHKADADDMIPGGHGHILDAPSVNDQGNKVDLTTGEIYTHNNKPTGKFLKSKTLEELRHKLKKAGIIGGVITVVLILSEVAEAAECDGISGVVDYAADEGVRYLEDTVLAVGAGTTVIGGTAAAGGTLTAGGTTIVSGGVVASSVGVGTVAAAGGAVVAAGAIGYGVGTAIANTSVGQTITTSIGEGLAWLCTWCFNW